MNPHIRQPRFAKYDPDNILARMKVTKLLEVYIARALAEYAEAHDPGKIVINVVNPGLCRTKAAKHIYTGPMRVMFGIMKWTIGISSKIGSRTLVHAATQCGPETNGAFLSMNKVKSPGKFVVGPEGPRIQSQIWRELGEVLVNLSPGLKKYFDW